MLVLVLVLAAVQQVLFPPEGGSTKLAVRPAVEIRPQDVSHLLFPALGPHA